MVSPLKILLLGVLATTFISALPMASAPAFAVELDKKGKSDAKEAMRFYKEGNYEDAARLFLRLSLAYPNMLVFVRNLGACYYYMRRHEPALSNLRDYLHRKANIAADDRAEVAGWIGEMERLRDQAAVPPAPSPPAATAPPPADPAPTADSTPPAGSSAPSAGAIVPVPPVAVPGGVPAPEAVPGGAPGAAPVPEPSPEPVPPAAAAPAAEPAPPAAPAPPTGPSAEPVPFPPGAPLPVEPSAGVESAFPPQYPPQYPPQPGYAPPTPYAAQPGYPPVAGPGYPPGYGAQPGYVPEGPPTGVAAPAAPSPESTGAGRKVAAWLLGLAGVGTLGLGGYFTYKAYSDARDLEKKYDPSKEDQRKTAVVASGLCYGLGGAAFVGAIILGATGGSSGQVALAPAVGPGLAGAMLGGSF